MEYINFSKLTESDFDEIVLNAGGQRYTDNPKIQEKNCDYIFKDAVIELKIIEEEPIEKETKQLKLSKLFGSDTKSVIIDPLNLKFEDQRKYYQILSSSIQSQLKKASKQLQISATTNDSLVKIAIVMNNGLTMTSYKEFEQLAIKRTKNDTSGIDVLIVAGIYYFSDRFDMRVMAYFNDFHIRGKTDSHLIDKLRASWNKKVEEYMTDQVIKPNLNRIKEPITDLFFELDGIRYIKPAPQWGKQSEFYGEAGRPREDSSRTKGCKPVANVLPSFNSESYSYAKQNIDEQKILLNSLEEYLIWSENEQLDSNDNLTLLIPVLITKTELEKLPIPFTVREIQDLASKKFEKEFETIYENSIEYSTDLNLKNYIFVEVEEIGMDKANDIAFISHIKKNGDFEQSWLVTGEHLKYQCALALASVYCMHLEAEGVCCFRNEDYKWK